MADGPYVSLERAQIVRVEIPELAAWVIVTSVEDHKGREWRSPRATVEGPAPGAFTVGASHVGALHRGLVHAFDVFEKEFGARRPQAADLHRPENATDATEPTERVLVTLTRSHRAVLADLGPYTLREDGAVEDGNGFALVTLRPHSTSEETEWDRAVVAAINAIASAP